jgi:magnesium transporter
MVKKLIKKRARKVGLSPGSMVHIGEKKIKKVQISLIDYDVDHFESHQIENIEEVIPFKDKPTVNWINFYGLHEIDLIEKIGNWFHIHPLVLEDILNTDQRPKVEIFDNYLFLILKMLSFDEEKKELHIEQLSVIMGDNYVITFQERIGDYFNPVRERIRNGKGRIRKNGADYLTFALMDVVIDNYFIILEKTAEVVEDLEERVVKHPDQSMIREIQHIKRELIFLRKSVWPLREVISSLVREEIPQIRLTTIPFYRDLYDHTIQVIDTVETFRDVVAGIMDLYLSSISNKMNEVMKVLTIIATIFIPLTFLAGIYGMNFEFMPELKWKWAYPTFWLVMMSTFTILFFFFKKKKWL